MNKFTRKIKAPIDRLKTQAVHWVAQREKVSTSYVYGVLNGTFKDGRADTIKRQFNKKYDELRRILS